MYTTRHHVTSPVIYTNIILLYVILALREISAASIEGTQCKAGCITYTSLSKHYMELYNSPLASTMWFTSTLAATNSLTIATLSFLTASNSGVCPTYINEIFIYQVFHDITDKVLYLITGVRVFTSFEKNRDCGQIIIHTSHCQCCILSL